MIKIRKKNSFIEKTKIFPNLISIPTSHSVFLFSKTNLIRKLCTLIVSLKIFDRLVLFFITASTVKLALDTFYDKKDGEESIFNEVSFYFSYSINIFFTWVIILKTISIGFIMQKKSFCRDYLNVINLFAVLGFYVSMFTKQPSQYLTTFFQV